VWILYLILGLGLLFAALLTVPVDVLWSIERGEQSRSTARVTWLWGLVGRDMRRRKKKPEAAAPKKRRRRLRPVVAVLRTRGFASVLLRFLRDLLGQLRVRYLTLDAQIGLADPFETGLLFSIMGPATVYLGAVPATTISIRPGFETGDFRGRFGGDVRVVPATLVWPCMRFLLSGATLRALVVGIRAWRR